MMKLRQIVRVVATLACVLGLGQAFAQVEDAAEMSAGLRIAQERERIEAQRQAEADRQKNIEAACYQRFAVNDCVQKSRVEHRRIMSDLKRQEIRLNDRERREKASLQMKRLEEKASSSSRDEDLLQRQERAVQVQVDRDEQADKKLQQRSSAEDERRGRVQEQQVRELRQAEENKERAAKADAAAAERAEFLAKQKEAERRRQAVRDKKAAGTASSQPLPQP